MNFHIQAFLPILAAATADVAIAVTWYSESLFGPMWRKAGGKAVNKENRGEKLALHATASLVTAAALFISISIFEKAQTGIYAREGFFKIFSFFLQDIPQNNSLMSAMKTAGFMWLGFIVPTKAICNIWSSANLYKFGIEAIGQLISLTTMAAIISALS